MHKYLPLTLALLALAASFTALGKERASSQARSGLEARLESLSGGLAELGRLAGASQAPAKDLDGETLAALEMRVQSLEQSESRVAVADAVPASSPAQEVEPETPSAKKDPAGKQAELEELKGLVARLIGSDYDLNGSDEEIQRFFALARESGALLELLGELEAAVAASPSDLQARMDLADAYVAKLMTMAHGPEQGVIGAKAEGQWREVVARDPGHWAANFALGNNYSFYPDVMGKTGEAIAYLETARSIQEKLDPAPDHVRTYLSLSRLYLREGRKDEARSILEAGLRHHPGNAEILAELERLDRAG